MGMMAMRWTVPGALAGVLAALSAAAIAPAGAQACSLAAIQAQPVAPAENTASAPTAEPVPVQVRFGNGSVPAPVEFAVARLKTSTLPQPVSILPAEVGTVVETIALAYDATSGTWNGNANANGWARYPGEYVWRVSGTQTFPVQPPPVEVAPGVWSVNSCSSLSGATILHDGRWVHRLTVLRASKIAVATGTARDGRVKVRGRVAKAFPGKVRLTIACPGKRARTTFVAAADGRWKRTVLAERGCAITAAVAAREGWTASESTVRVA